MSTAVNGPFLFKSYSVPGLIADPASKSLDSAGGWTKGVQRPWILTVLAKFL